MGVQSHLAVCCRATLPILCMGHVRVSINELERERPLIKATRCLMKQPGGVSHLEVLSRDVHAEGGCLGAHHLLADLRCASALFVM